MQVVMCAGAGQLSVQDHPIPELSADMIRAKVAFGGICGSDLHYYQHGGFGTVRVKEPLALGHEVSGVVDAVGADVEGRYVGERIAISPSRPCGHCRFCQLGIHNQCLNMRFYGSAMPFPHIQGAFCEYILLHPYQVHAIADHVTLSEAALAEPLSVGLHAIQRAGGVLGAKVLVTGCGPIGSLLIGALRRAGAELIVAADVAALPLKCAMDMGADLAINLATEPDALAAYKADKGYFDVVFEASGSAPAFLNALDVVRARGVVVVIGVGAEGHIPLSQLVGKEVDVRGTFRFHQEFATAVRFLNDRLVDGRPVITGVEPVRNALAAFDMASDKSKSLKVQLDFA